jgi:hypothetical protein
MRASLRPRADASLRCHLELPDGMKTKSRD